MIRPKKTTVTQMLLTRRMSLVVRSEGTELAPCGHVAAPRRCLVRLEGPHEEAQSAAIEL